MLPREQILPILKDTLREWSDDNVSRLAAALSYYALLSIAPLLLVMVALLGLIFGEDIAREHVVDAMSLVVGPQGMVAIDTIAKSAHQNGTGFGSLIGLAIALFGASGAFVELQASLNAIWNIPPKRGDKVLLRYLIDRAWSFVLVLGVAVLLLCSLLSSAVLAIVGHFFENVLPGGGALWQFVNSAISLGIITLLFAVVFKLLPDVKIRWSDVWLGSFITALLFVLGNLLLGLYLGKSGVTSSYGGAGSIVALMIWVYYSTQLVFLGAELTQVYTQRVGSHAHLPRPEPPVPRSSKPSLSES